MKNKTIKIIKNEELAQTEKYNELLDCLAKSGKSINALRSFQMGFSPTKYESLFHEVKKVYEISDLDIYNYEEGEEDNQEQEPTNTSTPKGDEDGLKKDLETVQNPVIAILTGQPEAQAGIKLRDEYPFLSSEDCSDEYKVLVADKITAWKDFAKQHQNLALFIPGKELESEDFSDAEKEKVAAFEVLSDEEKQEALYQIAKASVESFQLNGDIKDELDYYKETGKVLGKHPKLELLKIKEEIFEMSEADLVKHRGNGQKNYSKAKGDYEADPTKVTAKRRMELWEFRVKLATERLEVEFKHQFEKK